MLKSEEEYREELRHAVTLLSAKGLSAEVSGEGLGSFIFATRAGWSIELSRSEDGIWVEFWKPDSHPADHDRTYPTLDEGLHACERWLLSNVF